MLARVVAAAASAVAALAVADPGASAGLPRGCPPSHATVLARSPSARVYALAGNSRPTGPTTTNVYGCLLRGGRPIALASSAARRSRVGPVVLAGDVVAYASTLMAVDTASSSVRVLDLERRRRLRELPATSGPRRPESFTSVTALVVTRVGAVAWIGQDSRIGGRPTFEVHRADRSGVAELDSGAAIGPASLRLSGHTVSWRDHGRTLSARLA
jgi:hypothetical protein